MPFRDDAQRLIDQKKFDELESLWMSQLDSDPSDVDSFIATARVLRKSEQRTQSDTLLGLLSDTLIEKKLWPLRLQVRVIDGAYLRGRALRRLPRSWRCWLSEYKADPSGLAASVLVAT